MVSLLSYVTYSKQRVRAAKPKERFIQIVQAVRGGAHEGEARRTSASGRLYLEPALRSWVSKGEDTVMPVASPLDVTEY